MLQDQFREVAMPENRGQTKYRRRGIDEREMAKEKRDKETNELRKSRKERRNR